MIYAWHVATGTSSRYYHGGSVAYAALGVRRDRGRAPARTCCKRRCRSARWRGSAGSPTASTCSTGRSSCCSCPAALHGLHGLPLNLLRLAATFVAATLSFYLVELPIRERRRPTLPWRPAPRAERRAPPARAAQCRAVARASRGRRHARNRAGLDNRRVAGAQLPRRQPGATEHLAARGLEAGRIARRADRARVDRAPGARRAPVPAAPKYVPPPHTDFPWSYGDPLFCGTPRASETDEAIDEAHKLGPPHARGRPPPGCAS